MRINIMYYEHLLDLNPKKPEMNTDSKAWMLSLKRRVRELQDTMVCLFKRLLKCSLFTMKFNLPNHTCYNLE